MSEVNENTAIAVIESLAKGTGIMSTLSGDDRASKIATLNAITNAAAVNENLGKTINLVHVVTQAVTVTDAVTGEAKPAVRAILLDADGTSYACVSDGVIGSLRDIFGVLGMPSTWDAPLPVQVVEQKGNAGRKFMKLILAPEDKAPATK